MEKPALPKAVFLAVIFAILLVGVVAVPANADSHLPDCKVDSKCLLKLGEKWKSITTADIQAMLDAGADVHARDDFGRTPLFLAASRENTELISVLIQAGADVNATSDDGETPLYWAAKYANAAVVHILIKAGADVKARADGGNTPLHATIRFSRKDRVILILVKAGANVNARNNHGRTPLHKAAFYADELISILIQAGADVNVKDRLGLTPLDIAKVNLQRNIIRELKKAGGKCNLIC